MDPLGHVAGTASSVVGCLQTLVGGMIGALVGRAFDGTIVPLCTAMFVLTLASCGVVVLAEGRNLFGRNERVAPQPLRRRKAAHCLLRYDRSRKSGLRRGDPIEREGHIAASSCIGRRHHEVDDLLPALPCRSDGLGPGSRSSTTNTGCPVELFHRRQRIGLARPVLRRQDPEALGEDQAIDEHLLAAGLRLFDEDARGGRLLGRIGHEQSNENVRVDADHLPNVARLAALISSTERAGPR